MRAHSGCVFLNISFLMCTHQTGANGNRACSLVYFVLSVSAEKTHCSHQCTHSTFLGEGLSLLFGASVNKQGSSFILACVLHD